MSDVIVPYRFVVKRDTAANFTSANTLLLAGEWALELDTGKMKMGDGTTAWNSLPYKTLSATPCFRFTTDTGSTADSDPGAGLMKWNNATQSSASKLFFDDATADTGTDLSNLFAELAASSTTGILHMVAESGAFKVYKWTGVADGTGYFKFTVSHLVSSGGNFSDNVTVRVAFYPMPAGGGGGGGSGFTFVRKASSESRASNTTFADDTDLRITLAAGTKYHIRGRGFFKSGSSGGFKYQGAYSGTTTGIGVLASRSNVSAATSAANPFNLATEGQPSGTNTTASGGVGSFEIDMIVETNAGGTFSIQWAQNSSNATATTMMAGSYLSYLAF